MTGALLSVHGVGVWCTFVGDVEESGAAVLAVFAEQGEFVGALAHLEGEATGRVGAAEAELVAHVAPV